MKTDTNRRVANMSGDAALPRKNGELVFEAPWEGRAFGIAVAMNENGLYKWGEFRDQLVAELAAAHQGHVASSYYQQWLSSLEKLIIAKGFTTSEELNARTAEYASGQRDEDHE